MEFWKDLTLILNTHPKLLLLFDYAVSDVEWNFVRDEAIVENETNMLVYFLDIKVRKYSKSRTQFNEVLNTDSSFTVLQKQWKELSKMF